MSFLPRELRVRPYLGIQSACECILDLSGNLDLLRGDQRKLVPVLANDLMADPKRIVVGTFPVLLHSFRDDRLLLLLADSLDHKVISHSRQNLAPESESDGILSLSQQLHSQIDPIVIIGAEADPDILEELLGLALEILNQLSIIVYLTFLYFIYEILFLVQPMRVLDPAINFLFDLH